MEKKIMLMFIIGAVIITGFAFEDLEDQHDSFENLQVLPKGISPKELQRIMVDDFQDGLGVSCNYCHATKEDSHKLDYASDAKPEKEIARAMMRMTIAINKDHFQLKDAMIGDSLLVIGCGTCHRGLSHPE